MTMQVDPWQVVAGAFSALMAALAWVVRSLWSEQHERAKRHAAALADHSDRITRMEASLLTKADLQQMELRLQDAVRQSGCYTSERIGVLQQSVDRAQQRIDNLEKRGRS